MPAVALALQWCAFLIPTPPMGLVAAETAVKDPCGTGDMRGITEITLRIIMSDYGRLTLSRPIGTAERRAA